MRNLDDLLEEAKWGKLTEEEVNYIVKRIKASTPDDEDPNLYTLLHTLGKSGAIQYRKLVESFLYYPTNTMIAKIALQTLCDYWGYHKNYINELKMFVKGTEWDKDEDVRIVAIGSAGAFLRESQDKDKKLLQLLIDILVNDNENEIMKECAYEALARAVGQEWHDLLRDENIPNPVIVDKVFKMLKEAK